MHDEVCIQNPSPLIRGISADAQSPWRHKVSSPGHTEHYRNTNQTIITGMAVAHLRNKQTGNGENWGKCFCMQGKSMILGSSRKLMDPTTPTISTSVHVPRRIFKRMKIKLEIIMRAGPIFTWLPNARTWWAETAVSISLFFPWCFPRVGDTARELFDGLQV